jgi:hypothetical protein
MEISQLFDAYQAGRVRHFRPYLAPDNLYSIDLQVLIRRADDTGDHWVNSTLKRDGAILWYPSQEAAVAALEDVGLKAAYEKRFELRDGLTYLRW